MTSDDDGSGEVKRSGGLHDFKYSKKDLDAIRNTDTDATRRFKKAYREWHDNPQRKKAPEPRFEDFVRDEPARSTRGTISVWVKTANQQPVRECEVTLKHKGHREQRAVTNDAGVAEFSGLDKQEDYRVTILADGKHHSKQVFLAGPRTTTGFLLPPNEVDPATAEQEAPENIDEVAAPATMPECVPGEGSSEPVNETATRPGRSWTYGLIAAVLALAGLIVWLLTRR